MEKLQRNITSRFSTSASAEEVNLSWKELGVVSSAATVRDLWLHQDSDGKEGIHIRLKPHASLLYRVR